MKNDNSTQSLITMDDQEQTSKACGDMITEAINRLSDESSEDNNNDLKKRKEKQKVNKGSSQSSSSKYHQKPSTTTTSSSTIAKPQLVNNDYYHHTINNDDDDDDNDNEVDDNFNDDEKTKLLPSTSTTSSSTNKKFKKPITNKTSSSIVSSLGRTNKASFLADEDDDDDDVVVSSTDLHRRQYQHNNDNHHHHLLLNQHQQEEEEEELLLQQQPTKQKRRQLQQQPTTKQQQQRQQQKNRANKYSGEHNSTDIFNENIINMGLTPPQPTTTISDGSDENGNNTSILRQDDQESIEDQMDKERLLCNINWYIYLVTMLSAIGGFLFGYDTGIVSGAMVFIRDYFHLSTTMQEVVISITILTAWIFSFVAGYLTNKFGRKLVIILASFIFTIGGLMMALAPTEYVLLVGRAIVGLAIGLSSMAIPVYIAEVAPVKIRGKLVSTNVCFITFGQFVASIVAGLFSQDQHNGWRWMLGLASVPSFLQMIFFFFLPESPRWLIEKRRYDQAYDALKKFRYADTREEKILLEFENIKKNCLKSEQERNQSKSIKTFLSKPSILKALLIGSLLSIFQQVAGINTVMYYSATIIQMSGVNDKSTAVWLSALTASINFIFSFVGLALVERLGRRILALSSLFGVVVSLLILAAGFQLAQFNSPPVSFRPSPDGSDSMCSLKTTCDQCVKSHCGFCFYDGHGGKPLGSLIASGINGTCLALDHNELPYPNSTFCINGTSDGTMMLATDWCPSQYSWMTLAGLMLYLFFFAPGMGPMPWTINSEIYPLWARSFCYSVSTSFNWFFNFFVSLTFLTLTDLLNIHGAFYLYAGLTLFGFIIFFFILPETKGKTLEEIEALFQGPLCKIAKNSRRLSHYDNVDGSVHASSTTVSTTASNLKI